MIYLSATLPLLLGFLIDCILGDPYSMPHPVRLIGKFISKLEAIFKKRSFLNDRLSGSLLCLCVSLISCISAFVICFVCYKINLVLGIIAESCLCYYLLAAKCLRDESMKVYTALSENDTEKARKAVSMIVGRDTNMLDETGIIKAAVETVAENTSDGVTAPIFWIMLGGAPAGMLYKAVNTMDSMIGYKNEKYILFGRTAARFDDVLNYFPSRLTALIMIVAAFVTGLDGKSAFRIWRRDRYNHASPNSAQTEAVCAGALDVQLAGDAHYFGKLCKKRTIGDNVRKIEKEDIKKVNRLMYASSVIMLILAVIVRILIFGGFYG